MKNKIKKKRTKFIGILNVTPDSFFDGGRFEKEDIVKAAMEMVQDGAEILDIGGESSGPGSQEVSLEEELGRVIPNLQKIRKALPDVIISVDTWKSEVANEALKAGANMINDVTAGRGDERIFKVASDFKVPIILMYSKNQNARTDREIVYYADVVKTIKDFLKMRIKVAEAAGVKKIIIDPGMGAFVSGDPSYSFEIIDRFKEFEDLSFPILVGTSRKGFLGSTPEERFNMTLCTTLVLKDNVDYLRVHDVAENFTCDSLGSI